ncbi:(d)CMP kinase [Propionibacteriaceae bacterium G57]|uniref:(d)CMP kinase n=1 Tax=Aestuariimicrobium sp. G57 TaxID=3418485 RepID=UPI003DA788DB
MAHPQAQTTTALVVAIDGPSGSGKSSTARGVAQRLGLAYLDTGAMYRAVTVAYLRSGLQPDQTEQIAALADAVELTVTDDPEAPAISLDGTDVSDEIREPRVSQHVSIVATNTHVRDVLTDQMRALVEAADQRIVVEGRDITTVVWPQAEVRVLLVADPRARMARRQAELDGKLNDADAHDQIVRRDRDDATVSEFATPADGVTLIDSTHLNLEQVIDHICSLAPTPPQE